MVGNTQCYFSLPFIAFEKRIIFSHKLEPERDGAF